MSIINLPLQMIINDFDISGFVIDPFKANAPLIVDSDAVLSGSVPLQFFKMIARRSQQILQIHGIIQVDQFTPGSVLNLLEQLCGNNAQKYLPRLFGSKRFNHNTIISRRDIIFKRGGEGCDSVQISEIVFKIFRYFVFSWLKRFKIFFASTCPRWAHAMRPYKYDLLCGLCALARDKTGHSALCPYQVPEAPTTPTPRTRT
jgi:hypothetical protein